MTPKPSLKIELTHGQQQQIEQSTGKRVQVVELRPETLECRAAPRVAYN